MALSLQERAMIGATARASVAHATLAFGAAKPQPQPESDAPPATAAPSNALIRLNPHNADSRRPRVLPTPVVAPGVASYETSPVPVRLVLSGPEGRPIAWLDAMLPSSAVARRAVAGEIGLHFSLPDETSASDDLSVAPGLRFHAGRAAGLATGGVNGESAESGRVHGFVNAGGARFDLYDVSLRWDAYDPGPVTITLLGGVRALDVQTGVAPGSADPLAAGDMRDVVAVPVVGGGLRWNVAEGFYFSGSAATHTLDSSATFSGLTAETGIELSPRVGVFAGYQYIRSALDLETLSDELSQEGVFARLEISF